MVRDETEMADIGNCWLCGRRAPLTEEHIPPRRAFNDAPMLYKRMSERSKEVGRVVWTYGKEERGLAHRSLCQRCNSHLGGQYGGDYVSFLRELAHRVERAHRGAVVTIEVAYPLRIMKAVTACFLTANGEKFARAQEWMRRFLRNSKDRSWPPHVQLYAYACAFPGGRQTGLMASLKLSSRTTRVLSEFSFWPLGAVLSFNPLDHEPVVPVHHWAAWYEYRDRGPVTLSLPVHTFATSFPLDFRSHQEVAKAVEESRRHRRETE